MPEKQTKRSQTNQTVGGWVAYLSDKATDRVASDITAIE
jgi:hypothetical protein